MLTEQQRLLVEENTPLAVKCGWRWKYKLEEYGIFPLDECISMCYEGLCKAAKGFDESKGVKFSTFAYRCMNNEFYLWFKYNNRQKRGELNEVISLETKVSSSGSMRDREVTLIDLISVDVDNDVDNEVLIHILLDKLNQKEIDYLTMYYLKGMTYAQIGNHYGTSYQNAQQKIRNTVKKCQKLLS